MSGIILHNYPQSPVAEKVRVALGIKGLDWQSVEIPRLPPKPDLVPLTGGYRRTPVMVKDAIDRGVDRDLGAIPAHFCYLPFEHSEDLADQQRYQDLLVRFADTERGPEMAKYGLAHMELIERFGRFPHRNAALGRTSTPEELEYLKDPDAGF